MSNEMIEELQNMSEEELLKVHNEVSELINRINKITEQSGEE